MGVNQQIFERYVNGEITALEGLPMQKQAKFQALSKTLKQVVSKLPEEIRIGFDITLTGTQNILMKNCNTAIEQLDSDAFYKALKEREHYDSELHTLADNFFSNLSTDKRGNKYDRQQGWETDLENTFRRYSKELNGCNEMLIRRVNGFYSLGISELVYGFPAIHHHQINTYDIQKMMLLAKLFSLRSFFESVKMQLAQSALIAQRKNNSNAAIARTLETDTKKLSRMTEKYHSQIENEASRNGDILMAESPMRAASAQEKLFKERKDKPEYAFVAYLLMSQGDNAHTGFQEDLMRDFLRLVNYGAFALAVRHSNEETNKPINAYLFKLRIINVFMRQYDYAITPAYEQLKKLGVKDDLIQCVLYEESKEFKKRIARAQRA